jgi:hypothetical protein
LPPIQLDAASFDRIASAAESNDLLAGPETGVLQPRVGAATVQAAGVDVENFVARVSFVNPAVDTDGSWDAGLAFREQSNGDHYRLTIASDGIWEFQIGLQPALIQGTVSSLNTRAGAINSVELVVDGDAAGFAVNGSFVSALATSELHGTSDVWVGAGFHQENVSEGQELRFDDFSVWELSLEVSSAQPELGTPVAEPGEETRTPMPAQATPVTAPAAATPVVSRDAPRQRALRLQEQNHSGVDGVVVLSEGEDSTTLIVTARGTRGGEIVVVHNGTCSTVDESPSSMVGEIDARGKITAEVELSLPELTDGNHSIAILGGTDEGDKIVACGVIPTSD